MTMRSAIVSIGLLVTAIAAVAPAEARYYHHRHWHHPVHHRHWHHR